MELEFATLEGAAQSGDELAAEDAAAAVFLASDLATGMTGTVINLTAGKVSD